MESLEMHEDDSEEYDYFDDFGLQGKCGGGSGGDAGGSTQRLSRRQQNRGGAGAGTIYSSKHVRAKEAQQRMPKKSGQSTERGRRPIPPDY
jgi:hypothetical protein